MDNKNEIELCVKLGSNSATHAFNKNHKVRHAVDWAAKEFRIDPKALAEYDVYLEVPGGTNVALQLDGAIKDYPFKEGSCILIQPRPQPYG